MLITLKVHIYPLKAVKLKNCYILCDLVFVYMYMSFDFRLPVTIWLQCISIHRQIEIKS